MAFDSNIKGYMTFGKSFSRGGAFPLEAYEIWTDYDALVAYAANTNPDKDPSYIGQKVAYVDKVNNKVVHYGIEIDGSLKELGCAPIGDEKSIVVAEDGTVSLKGINALVFERELEGGGKEDVQYQPLMTKNGLVWVEPSKTTVEGLATLIEGLTARVKALEDNRVTEEELAAAVKVVADKVGVPAEGDTSTATLYERIAAEVARATGAEAALSNRIGVAKNGEDAATGVYAYVDGVVSALVNGVDPDKIDSLNELIAWVEAHPAIVEELDGRLDAVEGILEGIGGEGEKATVKGYVDDTFATKSEFNTYKQTAENTYATKDELKTTDDKAVSNANAINNLTGRLDGIVAQGGEPNVINNIKVNGVVQTITDKAVDITVPTNLSQLGGYTAIDERITAAKKAGDDAATAVETLKGAEVKANANAIAAVDARLKTVETASGTHNTEIGTLKGQVNALLGEDNKINTALGTLEGKITAEADARSKEDARLAALISGNSGKIGKLETKVNLAEGETITSYVAAEIAKVPTYNDTEVRNLISAEASRADAEEKRIVGLIEAEASRADAAEKANKALIDGLDATLKAAIENDGEGLDSIKELALWIEEHETEILPVIEANTAAIKGLNNKVNTGTKTVSEYVADAIAGIPAATSSALGLVKATSEVTVGTDGALGIGYVSTDKLIQGLKKLILDGGDAEVSDN
jgi:hypothetical protein